MISSAALFWTATAAGLIMLITFGGRSGFAISIAIGAGMTATYFSVVQWGFEGARPTTLLIDTVVLIVSITVALRSKRYWPTWFAGILMVSVLTSLAGLMAADFVPRAFINLSGFLLLPALWVAALGCWRDQRAGVAEI